MPNFKFLESNYINTTTQITVTSNAGNRQVVIDKHPEVTFSSDSQTANTFTIRWIPGSSTNVSRVLIQNHNFSSFNITYDGSTVQKFSPELSVSGYTNSNTYYEFATQAVTSVDIHVWSTTVANAERFLGQLIVGNEALELNANPNFTGYRPIRYKKGSELEMIDGGIVSIFTAQKYRAQIALQLINTATYDTLTAMYNANKDYVFVPFPVNTFTTYWNGEAYPIVFTGNLEIDNFRSNILAQGYQGNISIQQIPD